MFGRPPIFSRFKNSPSYQPRRLDLRHIFKEFEHRVPHFRQLYTMVNRADLDTFGQHFDNVDLLEVKDDWVLIDFGYMIWVPKTFAIDVLEGVVMGSLVHTLGTFPKELLDSIRAEITRLGLWKRY